MLFFMLMLAKQGVSQTSDTIVTSAKYIDTRVLKEGSHHYLVYFTNGENTPKTDIQFWTREIERSSINGTSIIIIRQKWEHKDTIMHTATSVCDGKTFAPQLHTFWWKQRGTASVNFETDSVILNGITISGADTSKRSKAIWQAYESSKNNYFLNWHLDMEVFQTLPYREARTFVIQFYDPGVAYPLQQVMYTVVGTAKLKSYDNNYIDCWLMVHEEKGNKETYWICKKTKAVLKLEQVFNGNIYRYKIKLGFNN
jgi:hypothetical protein